MCPPRVKSVMEYLIEAANECWERHPELFEAAAPSIDDLDYAGV